MRHRPCTLSDVTAFATPALTWTAMVAALDEDPTDDKWAIKLAIQCRDHLRLALMTEGVSDLAPGPSITEWTRDPGKKPMRRVDNPNRIRRHGRDMPGGSSGPTGMYVRWHVLLATLIGHEFESCAIDAPTWTRDLKLAKEWIVPATGMSDHQVRTSSPDWMSERGIFISKRVLKVL